MCMWTGQAAATLCLLLTTPVQGVRCMLSPAEEGACGCHVLLLLWHRQALCLVSVCIVLHRGLAQLCGFVCRVAL